VRSTRPRSTPTAFAGSFTRPTTAQAGDEFLVDYGPLGSIALRFV
jgi:2-oxo-hept-3-ene-1,7-dioate hydratase